MYKSRNPFRTAVPTPFSLTHFTLHLFWGNPANHMHSNALDPQHTPGSAKDQSKGHCSQKSQRASRGNPGGVSMQAENQLPGGPA